MQIQAANITWQNGLPYTKQFDAIYFVPHNSLAHIDATFLAANNLKARFSQLDAATSFTIAQTSFGTGLSFLATWHLWHHTPRHDDTWLHFICTEQQPLNAKDLTQILALWPNLAAYTTQLLAQYPPLTAGWHRLVFAEANISLTLVFGDIDILLPELSAQVDTWFLNSISANHSLDVLAHIAKLSKTGTTLSTSNTSDALKQGLEKIGFELTHQNHLLTATLAQKKPQQVSWLNTVPISHNIKKALIIGAGIAGVSCARALALRGWQVTLIEQASHAMSGASGNPAAIIYPKLAPPHLSAWHFQQQAYLYLINILKNSDYQDIWQQTGLLWVIAGNQQREADKLAQHPWPYSLVHKVDAVTASDIAGLAINHDCMYFPQAGYVQPQALAKKWLSHANIKTIYNTQVTQLIKQDSNWLAIDGQGKKTAQAPVVILANALAAQQFSVSKQLPLTAVRGQIGQFASTNVLSKLKSVLCYGGYLTPSNTQNQHCIGASFWPKNSNTDVTQADHTHNQQLLHDFLPNIAQQLPDTSTWHGRAALRAQTTDYLPIVGALPVYESFCQDYAAFKHGKIINQAPVYHQGLYVSLGHGSKGFCYAPLAAEILAAQLNHEPLPIAQQVLNALHPARFWVKQLKRGLI